MSDETKGKEMDELLLLGQYIENFNIHFSLLLRRYKRFLEINSINNKDIDVITYLDIIVVQLRAMCVERADLKKNYTVQNLLRKIGECDLADQVDAMLNTQFLASSEDFTIRQAIKVLADEFICHYDSFDGVKLHRLSLAEIIEKQLRNPYDAVNLDYIIKTLIDCVGEGLTIKL